MLEGNYFDKPVEFGRLMRIIEYKHFESHLKEDKTMKSNDERKKLDNAQTREGAEAISNDTKLAGEQAGVELNDEEMDNAAGGRYVRER